MRTSDPIAETIADRLTALQAAQRLSAWSLIVSFLGDAIGPRGGVVSAGTVQSVMQRLGIGAGAVRTAISRLSADGWIERSREGRNSFYRLSGDVEETVLAAERRIYAASSLLPPETTKTLIITSEPLSDTRLQALETTGALQISPQVLVCFASAAELPAALRLPGATLAETPALAPGATMRDQIALARQADEMEALQQAYAPVLASLETHAPPSPEDAMALRCLMIHEWRRVALRVLAVPADLIEPQDREPETRALVAAIYARLLPASEAWLDANASTPEGTLPPADPRLARRFQPSRA
ncbi:MAG: phenylacetic acid degradation operon negative regulatory protein PaaX [Hoeflea sp.]|uniref:PaaX family transcriptional regulator C-terminal domain-containing protein n=1 Tax=Hoeflea sp. TaxID=1940281 RepID=UPI000C0E3A4E|nr:PaaX family transcriptional regulator C-terminal domain-containing protein [Hoeflea sp.]PHR18704.1 MAG: phenylacetic acid degradation operon negative regulatory protein PaaX [Hoeflea sp.]